MVTLSWEGVLAMVALSLQGTLHGLPKWGLGTVIYCAHFFFCSHQVALVLPSGDWVLVALCGDETGRSFWGCSTGRSKWDGEY